MSSSSLRGMRSGRQRRFKSEINVVPYIDVMLVLLVIFMVAAPLTNPGVINLPSAEKSALPPTEYIEVTLKNDAAATVGINGNSNRQQKSRAVGNRDALLRELRDLHDAHPDLPLMIAAEKNLQYDTVVQTISQARKIGIQRVGLATRQ